MNNIIDVLRMFNNYKNCIDLQKCDCNEILYL